MLSPIGPKPLNCSNDVIGQWTTVLNVAMHFNQMLVSTRTLVASVTTGVFGAAAFAATQLKPELARMWKMPLGVVILIGGIAFLFCMWVMDHFYYYQLLLGAVDVAEQLERKCATLPGLTVHLSENVSRWWAATVSDLYYGFLALGEIVFAYFVWRWDRAERLTAGRLPISQPPNRKGGAPLSASPSAAVASYLNGAPNGAPGAGRLVSENVCSTLSP